MKKMINDYQLFKIITIHHFMHLIVCIIQNYPNQSHHTQPWALSMKCMWWCCCFSTIKEEENKRNQGNCMIVCRNGLQKVKKEKLKKGAGSVHVIEDNILLEGNLWAICWTNHNILSCTSLNNKTQIFDWSWRMQCCFSYTTLPYTSVFRFHQPW